MFDWRERVRLIWKAQCAFWGSQWAAGMALWGLLVTVWALWKWEATSPLPLVGGVLLLMLLLSPPVSHALKHLIAHEPAGERGHAWLAWYVAGALMHSPVSTFLVIVDALAQVGTPLVLAAALIQFHPALVAFAVVPSLWRVRIARALVPQGG